jgi:RHS repeat-associated protein
VASTPYRNTDLGDPTLEWTCTEYDQLGRVTKVGMFKGSTAPTDCESTTNRTGLTTTQYDSEWTIVTDPAGKIRKQMRDGLGRLAQVIEDPGNSPALNYSTTYAYDPLDNLTGVTQGAQTRAFVYGSLNRLTSATNPESGTVTYTYYDSGDLKRRTDARSAWAESAYDPLHRILTKTYSDSTPPVNYEYYLASSLSSPNIGQLKSVSSSEASTSYISYNQLGLLTCARNTISGFAGFPTFNYDWYLNGAIKSIYYPSGRLVSYDVDDAGRVSKASASGKTYMDTAGITHPYTPDGRIAQMKLGNNLWETRDYQTPGTTTYYKLGTTQGNGDLVQLGYNFSGTGNNGNVVSQQISRFNNGLNLTQSFTYDGVNRLLSATEGSSARNYEYDQYGNRWIGTSNWPAANEPKEPISQNNFIASTNRLTITGVQYDAAGNQTTYGAFTLGYDAESRNTAVTSTSSGNGSFAYDGEGRRIKKVWTPNSGTAVTTYFVYNVLGQLAAEYSSEASASTGASWIFTDMLGSVRAITSESQSVEECYDYEPFGRMLGASDNGRGSLGCFQANPDNSVIAQKFTSKERDAETGLDYFGARYYSGAQGRFTSPDKPLIDQHVGVPQSWNLYSYVRNNPLKYIDINGKFLFFADSRSWSDFYEMVQTSPIYAAMIKVFELSPYNNLYVYSETPTPQPGTGKPRNGVLDEISYGPKGELCDEICFDTPGTFSARVTIRPGLGDRERKRTIAEEMSHAKRAATDFDGYTRDTNKIRDDGSTISYDQLPEEVRAKRQADDVVSEDQRNRRRRQQAVNDNPQRTDENQSDYERRRLCTLENGICGGGNE